MSDEIHAIAAHTLDLAEDNQRHFINDRLGVQFHHCPEFLAHGTTNRAALLENLPIKTEPAELIAAWVETEYHPSMEIVNDAAATVLAGSAGRARRGTRTAAARPRPVGSRVPTPADVFGRPSATRARGKASSARAARSSLAGRSTPSPAADRPSERGAPLTRHRSHSQPAR